MNGYLYKMQYGLICLHGLTKLESMACMYLISFLARSIVPTPSSPVTMTLPVYEAMLILSSAWQICLLVLFLGFLRVATTTIFRMCLPTIGIVYLIRFAPKEMILHAVHVLSYQKFLVIISMHNLEGSICTQLTGLECLLLDFGRCKKDGNNVSQRIITIYAY